MASMRDIKRRKSSIQSTQQITKAMKLVSTVKLQRAKQQAEHSKTYFDAMYQTVGSMLKRAANVNHPYIKGNDSTKKAIVLITGNRGLAGGYHSNIMKLILQGDFVKEDTALYAIGLKGAETMQRYGYPVEARYGELAEEPSYVEAMQISKTLLTSYRSGEIGEIYLAYTSFHNTVTHEPKLIRLLPAEMDTGTEQANSMMVFEPEEEEALDLIIPQYVTSLIYGGLIESAASEHGARMQAMDAATSNAEEMISDLSLLYNRARQGAITQELTEIIAGAEAIS